MDSELTSDNFDMEDADFVPSGRYRPLLADALEQQNAEALRDLFAELHNADIADILEQASNEEREQIVTLWGGDFDAEVLTELEDGVREDVLELIPYSRLVALLHELGMDDLVYVIEDLDDDKRDMILGALKRGDRKMVTQSLSYPEFSAGRIMQREFVIAPEHWNVGDTIDSMRSSDDIPEIFHNVFVVNPALKPIGVIRLSRLMSAPRSTPLLELLDEDFYAYDVNTPQGEIAYAFNQYHLLSMAITDEAGRIVGVILVEDALEILDDEAEEDILRLAGVGDEEISDDIWETTKRRFPWLAVNLVTSIAASIVIGLFSETINALVALAILMPIVASMGGNAGTQTLTVAVRALATKDLTRANALRVVRRELFVGLGNGAIFAVIIGLIGFIWFGRWDLGLVLALAMIVNLGVAGLAGILIPMVLDRFGADPALASGAFVTTVTDIVGFFVFLGLAAIILI